MVFEAIVDAVARIVIVVGIPLLVVLFYLEGIIVGKLLQPPAVFVAVLAITRPSRALLVPLLVGCTLAVTAGQWTIYRGFDEDAPELVGFGPAVPYLDRVPSTVVDGIGEKRLEIVDGLFDRYGGAGILLTTFLPGVRGLMAIPAGISAYPVGRFLAATLASNALYFPLLAAVAYGILRIAGIE